MNESTKREDIMSKPQNYHIGKPKEGSTHFKYEEPESTDIDDYHDSKPTKTTAIDKSMTTFEDAESGFKK